MTTKNIIAGALLGTALILGSGVKDGNAEQINHIDETKSKVSDVLKEDPVKQLPVDLSNAIVKNGIKENTRGELLMAKLETNRENKESGEYGEIIQSLGKKEFVERFNQLDDNQKHFALKLYKAGKDDPVLLQEKSNKWLAINCVGLMERVTNLKHIIQTGDLEDGKTSDLSMKLEMILENCPSTQILLTSTMVSKFKEIETNATLRLQEELKIAKDELAKSKEGLAKSKDRLTKVRNENDQLDKEIAMLNALLVSSR